MPANLDGIDDVSFAEAIMDFVAEALPLDENRVYVIGMSNGGWMAFRLV